MAGLDYAGNTAQGFSGTKNWTTAQYLLWNVAGSPRFMFRILTGTDPTEVGEGVAIDDVSIFSLNSKHN